MEIRPDLIYDVGLFDGGDTAFYLYRGYKVVAIDANPLMIERAQSRFRKQIQEKRLTLLNVGIGATAGTATFWISDKTEWSSFDKAIASRAGTGHRPLIVPVVRFAEILAQYGVPHYLKIDIEGNDRLCVEVLNGPALPKYISVESECVGDSGVLSDEQAVSMLGLLRDVGYRRFKLVKQSEIGHHRFKKNIVRSNAAESFCTRVFVSVAQGKLRMRGLSGIARKLVDSPPTALGFAFSYGSSGPWGEDIPGRWMTFQDARAEYLKERHAFFSQDRSLFSFWYDWHATY